MSVALGLGLGFFVLTAVGSVLGVGILIGLQNTVDLLRQKAELLVTSEVSRTRQYFDSAQNQVDFIADQIARGEVEPGPSDEFTSLLMGSLAATPQIIRIQYTARNNRLVAAERHGTETRPLFQSLGEDTAMKGVVLEAARRGESFWGALLWRQEYGQATLNYHYPISSGGEFQGVVSALISVQRLSEFISDVETDFGANGFILYGPDLVLAHALMAFGYGELTRLSPLPKQAVFGDPILASMWEERSGRFLEEQFLAGPGIRFVDAAGAAYVFLHRDMEGFTDRPLIVGTYFPSVDMLAEVLRLKWAIILCLVISVVSAGTAAYIGGQIARPVRRLSEGAKKVHTRDLDQVAKIPGSFFRELSDASRSFNVMIDGLRERKIILDVMGKYVPERVAQALLAKGGTLTPVSTDATVLFVDLEGFTSMSEGMRPEEIVDMLNAYFSVLTGILERHGGVVTQFQGDAILATFNVPIAHADHARRAAAAAIEIRRTVAAGPIGGHQLACRIGINTGPVVSGAVGAAGRLNYTVHGDAVNLASRLEYLNKELGTRILVSEATAKLLDEVALRSMGHFTLRGKLGTTEVFSIDP